MQQKLSDSSEAVQADKEPLNTSLLLAACASVSTQVHPGSEDSTTKPITGPAVPNQFLSIYTVHHAYYSRSLQSMYGTTLPKEDKNHPAY